MKLLAIDPGSEQSAYVITDGQTVFQFGILENSNLAHLIAYSHYPALTGDNFEMRDAKHLAIETLFVRGMPTAQAEMETQLWAGRFIQAFGPPFTQIRRIDEKLTLCGSVRANDGNIRQALIDRWGGKERAVGKKKSPGPLYGISKDCWSALAVGVTYFEKYSPQKQSA